MWRKAKSTLEQRRDPADHAGTNNRSLPKFAPLIPVGVETEPLPCT